MSVHDELRSPAERAEIRNTFFKGVKEAIRIKLNDVSFNKDDEGNVFGNDCPKFIIKHCWIFKHKNEENPIDLVEVVLTDSPINKPTDVTPKALEYDYSYSQGYCACEVDDEGNLVKNKRNFYLIDESKSITSLRYFDEEIEDSIKSEELRISICSKLTKEEIKYLKENFDAEDLDKE